MWRQLTIVIFSLLLFSCATRKRCLEKFPPKVEVTDSIVVKDTTVYVPVKVVFPVDSASIVGAFGYTKDPPEGVDTIYIPKEGVRKTAKSLSRGVSAEVMILRDSIRVNCKTDSLVKYIDSMKVKLQVLERHKTVSQTVEVEVIKKIIPWWVWVSYIMIGLYIFRNPIAKFILKRSL